MALPATDAFTDSDGVQLTTHNSDWTLNAGDFDIQGNALAPDAWERLGAHWNADAFDDDQYAEATLVFAAAGQYIGVGVRHHASDLTHYAYTGNSDWKNIAKQVAGSRTVLATSGVDWTTGMVIRIEAEGTTITPKIDGAEDTDLGAQTDGAISSGSAGVAGYQDNNEIRLDNWEGGDIGAAPPSGNPWNYYAQQN